MMMRNFIYAATVLCLLNGCRKEAPLQGGADDAIGFRIYTPEVMSKAEVTEDNLRSESMVYVYETVNNIFDKALLTPETDKGDYTGRWMTDPEVSWTNYDDKRTSFYGIAYSPADAEGNGLTVSAKGLQIQVSQPKVYDKARNIDYLLSYEVPVEPAVKPKPLIALDMEHAMAKVEVYVYCADAMVNNDKYEIYVALTGLTFNNIYYSATLTCQNHRAASGAGTNYWALGNYGTADAVYSLLKTGESVTVKPKSDNIDDDPVMDFIAIPVDRADMTGYTLKVTYTVSVTDKEVGGVQAASFSSEFKLADYTDGWHSAHKVKYEFMIDSGINLTGKITDWVEVDYVEGVVLPEIKEGE